MLRCPRPIASTTSGRCSIARDWVARSAERASAAEMARRLRNAASNPQSQQETNENPSARLQRTAESSRYFSHGEDKINKTILGKVLPMRALSASKTEKKSYTLFLRNAAPRANRVFSLRSFAAWRPID